MGVEEAEKEDVVKYILKYDPEKQKKKKKRLKALERNPLKWDAEKTPLPQSLNNM